MNLSMLGISDVSELNVIQLPSLLFFNVWFILENWECYAKTSA